MAKVKRTREELEKDVKGTKAKKGRGKKEQVPESEELLAVAIANSTFNLNDQEGAHAVQAYDLTPCWQDVPPVQPDNPDDYGVADKSGFGADHSSHLSQALLNPDWITTYWHSKPRKPTILQFFGDQVSKRTLKRGLNYRTSSACWNTPPVKK
ncbi:hypothetical protein J437_LFUL004732 [Ladona fulva]|uniref:Uncharacterized protein n=1 Tax=Ladona fulva TaxID=123851 RepID=A0A8K0NVW5_LADFU|nr:hypothetical protein J437_LFUL004732 [Ladona fulva]